MDSFEAFFFLLTLLLILFIYYNMAQKQERYDDCLDGSQRSIFFAARTSPTSIPATTTAAEDDSVAELDEPPEGRNKVGIKEDFHRSSIKFGNEPKESLLTRALLSSPESDAFRPEIHILTDLGRHRSYHSNTSTASSVELTSDGELTSPARTNSPSPPFPSTLHRFNLGAKPNVQILDSVARLDHREAEAFVRSISAPVKADNAVETFTKKRCITFACGGQKPVLQFPLKLTAPATLGPERKTSATVENMITPQKRACAIKFACPATVKQDIQAPQQPAKPVEPVRSQPCRSPTVLRKSRHPQSPRPSQRTSFSSSRRASQSPLASRRKKPAFLVSNQYGQSSEATRFHEFASEEVVEDDWIRRDSSDNKKKITISDTLKKENAIRQLGKEAEEEALQEEEEEKEEEEHEDEDEGDDYEDNGEGSDGENAGDDSNVASDVEESDGNETDNEAGFAESDDESEGEEFKFWAPRGVAIRNSGEASTYRASAHRTTSESSIGSPRAMSPSVPWPNAIRGRPKLARRPKIRPGTPELPDSTDFVCGTLDEDRPLEEAYLSCLEVRRRERHRVIPQDIDPSFPTSDPENDDDEDEHQAGYDSDEQVFIHGKFEESDDLNQSNRRSRTRKSPAPSPKRLHSPPPKPRLRSPAPRRLFAGTSPRWSPRGMRSPPPEARQIGSIAASPPTYHLSSGAVIFTPLGQRPGLTHTKSLPRTPNAFGKQYRAVRLAAANAQMEDDETPDGYTRGAIDIVKGLERKRQQRREKLLRKQNNRARKSGPERKPQPGKGAERMRELGLHMAGKVGVGKATYILSV